ERLQPLGGLADPGLARDHDPPRPRRRRAWPPRRRRARREAGPPPDRARGPAAAGVLTRRRLRKVAGPDSQVGHALGGLVTDVGEGRLAPLWGRVPTVHRRPPEVAGP